MAHNFFLVLQRSGKVPYISYIKITRLLVLLVQLLKQTRCYISVCSSDSINNYGSFPLSCLPLRTLLLQFLWNRNFKARQSSLICFSFTSKCKSQNLPVSFLTSKNVDCTFKDALYHVKIKLVPCLLLD